ncbi:MAG TPA: phosphotransferase [Acidimicrobiales bacterium]|nr:phosphotransferase [Acidimicrobiales bacterium]
MGYPDDPDLVEVLRAFGVEADALLGHGGEAWVYALDDARVLRVLHPGGSAEQVRCRQRLVDELRITQPAFALPDVLDVGDVDGRTFAIERRLPGGPVMKVLEVAEGDGRACLIEAHLQTAAALGDLHLEPRGHFGDLLSDDPVAVATWGDYLEIRAGVNLAPSMPEFRSIDPVALAAPFPEPVEAQFVHLDAFAGNMLSDGVSITAVLDIGPSSVAGDRRFDPVAAVVYLTSADITPVATPADVQVALDWLGSAGLQDWLEPTRRWLAAFWSAAVDDPRVMRWCRSVLLP